MKQIRRPLLYVSIFLCISWLNVDRCELGAQQYEVKVGDSAWAFRNSAPFTTEGVATLSHVGTMPAKVVAVEMDRALLAAKVNGEEIREWFRLTDLIVQPPMPEPLPNDRAFAIKEDGPGLSLISTITVSASQDRFAIGQSGKTVIGVNVKSTRGGPFGGGKTTYQDIHVWDIPSGKLLCRTPPRAEYSQWLLSPNERWLACATDKVVEIYDCQSGTQVARLNHQNVGRLEFIGSDASSLGTQSSSETATGQQKSLFRLWSVDDWKEDTTVAEEIASASAIHISNNGKYLAGLQQRLRPNSMTWSLPLQSLVLWELKTGRLIFDFKEAFPTVSSANGMYAFSPDDEELLVQFGQDVHRVALPSGNVTDAPNPVEIGGLTAATLRRANHQGAPLQVGSGYQDVLRNWFFPGPYSLVSFDGKDLSIYNLLGKRELIPSVHPKIFQAIQEPFANTIVNNDVLEVQKQTKYQIDHWDTKTGKRASVFHLFEREDSLAITGDAGRFLSAKSKNRTAEISLHALPSGDVIETREGKWPNPRVAISEHGRRYAVWNGYNNSSEIVVYEADSPKELVFQGNRDLQDASNAEQQVIELDLSYSPIRTACFAKDEQQLAFITGKELFLYDFASDRLKRLSIAEPFDVASMLFAPSGEQVFLLGSQINPQVVVIDCNTGLARRLGKEEEHQQSESYVDAAFGDDPHELYLATRGAIRCFDLAEEKFRGPALKLSPSTQLAMSYSAERKQLVLASQSTDPTLFEWIDVHTGQMLCKTYDHASAGGNFIALTHQVTGGRITLLSTRTGKPVAWLEHPLESTAEESVNVLFSHDDRLAISWTNPYPSSLRVWQVPSDLLTSGQAQ